MKRKALIGSLVLAALALALLGVLLGTSRRLRTA